jgi:outer membrane protein assembly factor BamB
VRRTLRYAGVSIRLVIFLALVFSGTAWGQQKHYAATNLWQVRMGYYNQSSPALATNGVIYVTTWDGRLFAMNPDGTQRWVFKIGLESVSTPAVADDGTIYFGSRNRRVYAVTAEGNKRWEFPTGGWVDAAPALGADGTVYVGSWDKKFYALTANGKRQWEFQTGGPIVSSAAIDASGVIYFGSHDRKFYALNPDGSKRWEVATRGAIISSPAIGGEGEIYFTSTDGTLSALNRDGVPRWQLQTGGVTASSPVLGPDGTIYVSVNTNHCAVSAAGKLKWQRALWHPQPGYFGQSAASVLADGLIMFTGGDGLVMTVPAAEGDREWIWNYGLAGPSYSATLVATNGTVYAMGLSGLVHAVPRDTPLAATPWPTFRGNSQRTGRVAKGP